MEKYDDQVVKNGVQNAVLYFKVMLWYSRGVTEEKHGPHRVSVSNGRLAAETEKRQLKSRSAQWRKKKP
jgi:hypothetical protein